jgi:hypothetical protein
MALTEALIRINSHGITPNHTEEINTVAVDEYSVFFRVLPWRTGGQWDDIT